MNSAATSFFVLYFAFKERAYIKSGFQNFCRNSCQIVRKKMESNTICQICNISKSKYSCPRCHIAYCSTTCYQSQDHLECSELFYEKCVQEELKNCQSDPESKKRMLEILYKNQEAESDENLDSDDDEEAPDLATRMMNVNLDDEEAVWEKLTSEEKQEFRTLVANGNIMKILPEWEPWWKTKKRKVCAVDSDEDCDWKSKCPEVPSDIPELLKLTKVKPSPYVPIMLLNVLMSYVFTVRWFKGAHEDLPVEAVSTCISLSSTLRTGEVLKTSLEAFVAFEKDLSKCEWVKNEFSMDDIQEDIMDIINGSDGSDLCFSVKAAICDLNKLCSQSLVILKKGKFNHLKRFSGPLPDVHLLKEISRKLSYYLSWTAKHGRLLLNIL